MRSANDPDASNYEGEEARWQFALSATVTADDRLFSATLVNLSRTGFRLRTDQVIAAGTALRITVARWPKLRAHAVWVETGYLGARLDVPLRWETLSSMIRQSGGLDRLNGSIYI